jgi:hypothetical protein
MRSSVFADRQIGKNETVRKRKARGRSGGRIRGSNDRGIEPKASSNVRRMRRGRSSKRSLRRRGGKR